MTLGYAVATVIADFNNTHATNPKWTPHARFHVVWQISSYVGFGLLALALIWWPGPLAIERLYLAALMGAVVYAAFFVAVVTMPVYGGGAYDDNGYQPFAAPVPIFTRTLGRQYHRLQRSACPAGGRTDGAGRLTSRPIGPPSKASVTSSAWCTRKTTSPPASSTGTLRNFQ